MMKSGFVLFALVAAIFVCSATAQFAYPSIPCIGCIEKCELMLFFITLFCFISHCALFYFTSYHVLRPCDWLLLHLWRGNLWVWWLLPIQLGVQQLPHHAMYPGTMAGTRTLSLIKGGKWNGFWNQQTYAYLLHACNDHWQSGQSGAWL